MLEVDRIILKPTPTQIVVSKLAHTRFAWVVNSSVISEESPEAFPLIEMTSHYTHRKSIQKALKMVLPSQFFLRKSESSDSQIGQFHTLLPLIHTTPYTNLPNSLSFFAFSKSHPHSFKFYFDAISSWLNLGSKFNIVHSYVADFRLPEMSHEAYTFYEILIQAESSEELNQILSHFHLVETELRLGMQSSLYAKHILEIKSFSTNQKAVAIQKYMAQLIKKFPGEFNHDLLIEMQHVLIMTSDEFKMTRGNRQLSRIIGIHYLFRKNLKEALKIAPTKRHLKIKLLKLQTKKENKRVLGVLVGVNFLQDKEIFEEKHLLNAIQNYIPSVKAVEGSFFANRRGSEHICTLYLEIEKNNGEEFVSEEMRTLRRELPIDLKDRIEHLLHPVFMPRNEEEVIRNILSLSSQIKYLRDIPQVFISFDEQTHASLFFTIILVRVLRPGHPSIQELFKNHDSFLEFIHDRCQNAGNLRRKYKKEATVFRVKFPKEPFLRRDHSIDLNKARQAVVLELCRIVGDVRDYNGGMISKQNELICEFRHLLANDTMKYNDLLLENFFYSLTPVIMRTVLEPQALRSLFSMLLKSIEQELMLGETHSITELKEPHFIYIMIKAEDRFLKELLNRSLAKLQLHSSELAHSFLFINDMAYLGYIYRCNESSKQLIFSQTLQSTICSWKSNKK